MNMNSVQMRLKSEALRFLKSELGDDATLDFWNFDESEETKSLFLKSFKLLFKSGYDIALWNEVFDSVYFSALDKTDFTSEEWDFIENIKSVKKACREEGKGINNINQTIETESIKLIPINDEHIEMFKNFFDTDPDSFVNYSRLEYREFFFRCIFKVNNHHMFAIKEKTMGEIVGVVALKEICDYAHIFNIEYFVFPNFRKRGYAVEASRALIDCAFSGSLIAEKETARRGIYETVNENVELIQLNTSQDNLPSQNIAKKLGFVFTGREKRGSRIDLLGTYSDLLMFSLEKAENRNDKNISAKIKALQKSPIYAMSLGSKELFHSNFWAWLMEQDERFIELFFNEDNNKELVGIGREDNHRDITVYRRIDRNNKKETPDVYVIENKLKSIPTEEQLNGYRKEVEEWGVWKCGVLTGVKAPSFELPCGWSFLSHIEIAKRIWDTAQSSSKDAIMSNIEIIKEYCDILNDICDILEYSLETTDNKFYYAVDKLDEIRISDIVKKLKAEHFLAYLRKFLKEKESELPTVYNDFELKTEVSFHNGKATIDARYSNWTDKKPHWFRIGVQIEEYQYRRLIEQDTATSNLEGLYDKFKSSDVGWFDDTYDKYTHREIFRHPTTMKPRGNKKYNKYTGDSYNFVYQYYDLFVSINENEKEYFNYEEICQFIYADLKQAYCLIKK